MPVETELYDTLKVSVSASHIEIKKAYRKLALQHHPDKGGDADTFKKISAAYEILSDKEKKELYDKHGKNGLERSNTVPHEMFANLFNQSPFNGLFNMFNNVRKAQEKHISCTHKRVVTLEEICTRRILKIALTRDRLCECQKKLDSRYKCGDCNGNGKIVRTMQLGPMIQQIVQPCMKCQGHGTIARFCGNCKNGVVETQKIFSVHLTPDIYSGYQYKFSGEGSEVYGKLPGDFIVEIHIQNHPQFVLQNKDLLYTKKITLVEALCGYEDILTHPSGEKIELKFQGVINPNEERMVIAKGINTEGNLRVLHTVIFPKSLTDIQSKQIKEIFT